MEEERVHFESVLHSFGEYGIFMHKKYKDIENSWKNTGIDRDFNSIYNAICTNQNVFTSIGSFNGKHPSTNENGIKSPYRHLSKLQSTLHQMVRDWSILGQTERRTCYEPILHQLQTHVPPSSTVLLPGAGLGRLLVEIARLDYHVQGNEFSLQMLFTANYILNTTANFTIHPWLHDTNNTQTIEYLTQPVSIPDTDPSNVSHTGAPLHMSMTSGEFITSYSDQSAEWDCIITCFFLDTAPNAMEYIQNIHRLLKPNGIWINFGPLLYHWNKAGILQDDIRYQTSIEYTLEELQSIITNTGFTFQHNEMVSSTYNRNPNSMSYTVYNCSFFTVIKNNT